MDALVSTDWLAANLDAGDLIVLDASKHLPGAERDPRAEFEAEHIPGAHFLDMPSLFDPDAPVANAFPTREQVSQHAAALGISAQCRVVLYDDSAIKSAARAWLILRSYGVDKVAILDGGLSKWKAEGRLLEKGTTAPRPADFTACEPRAAIRSKQEMLANVARRGEQVVDARDAERFTGQSADGVHGLEGGHIPGACNLFFRDLFEEDGTFKDKAKLRESFDRAGIDLDKPVVTTCGSGMTASVLFFALHLLGVDDAALYDGSWSEWGADPATPKQTGEPA